MFGIDEENLRPLTALLLEIMLKKMSTIKKINLSSDLNKNGMKSFKDIIKVRYIFEGSTMITVCYNQQSKSSIQKPKVLNLHLYS